MTYGNIAFIPLRGGSKSIPLKNIMPINGRPLVYWTLDAAIRCSHIEKVFVATDSEEIKRVVEAYGSDQIMVVERSKETAEDHSTTESAMLEFANKYDFNNITLIQATSPLLGDVDLNKGFEMFLSGKYDSILSGVRQKRFIWGKDSEENYFPQNYDFLNRPLRQSFEGHLVENGAFYITSKERLLETKCRISGKIGLVEMKEETYFEIDEPSDWLIVEGLMKNRKRNAYKQEEILRNIKLLITDSDGVLTDGGMYYSENGDELKKFNTKDGMGVQLLREIGINTAIITGESVEIVRRRGKKLNIEEMHLGVKEKAPLVQELAKKYNISLNQIAYIGDDINDLEAIKMVGFGCSVCDGMEEVKNASSYVTKVKGGQGALREVAELILKAKRMVI
jgi:N-acylneuraminate cytidylyltransferase